MGLGRLNPGCKCDPCAGVKDGPTGTHDPLGNFSDDFAVDALSDYHIFDSQTGLLPFVSGGLLQVNADAGFNVSRVGNYHKCGTYDGLTIDAEVTITKHTAIPPSSVRKTSWLFIQNVFIRRDTRVGTDEYVVGHTPTEQALSSPSPANGDVVRVSIGPPTATDGPYNMFNFSYYVNDVLVHQFENETIIFSGGVGNPDPTRQPCAFPVYLMSWVYDGFEGENVIHWDDYSLTVDCAAGQCG